MKKVMKESFVAFDGADFAAVLGVSRKRAVDMLAYLVHVSRLVATRPTCRIGARYRTPEDALDATARAARVDRMREWTPAALRSLRRVA